MAACDAGSQEASIRLDFNAAAGTLAEVWST